MNNDQPELALFVAAVNLADQGLFIDALYQFREIVRKYPASALADDALFNAGLCQFHLNAFEAAIGFFRTVINDYPAADIYTYGNYREYGKTAAKCHYAIINCYLGLGQTENAAGELQRLAAYPDAYTESNLGEKITFYELAQKALLHYNALS
jgi:outer membrane protein assembly factor BamD (BamD/ComL family)